MHNILMRLFTIQEHFSVCLQHKMHQRRAVRQPVVHFVKQAKQKYCTSESAHQLTLGYTAIFNETAQEVELRPLPAKRPNGIRARAGGPRGPGTKWRSMYSVSTIVGLTEFTRI